MEIDPPVQVQQQVRGEIPLPQESQLLPRQLPRGRLAHRQQRREVRLEEEEFLIVVDMISPRKHI